MKLSSARALKSELVEAMSIAAFPVKTAFHEGVLIAMLRPMSASLASVQSQTMAAIGIAPGEGKQYKLAVRLFRQAQAMPASIMKSIAKIPDSEVDIAKGVRYAPRLTLKAGGSCGHYKITAGTLGGFVEDEDGYYVLSNNHVLANSNQCYQGDPILEPGPIDAVSGHKVIANLERWDPLSKTRRDGVDAAIARFTEDITDFYPWDYTGIGTIGKNPVADRFTVSRVIKKGRTTKVTRGHVSAFELDGVTLNYGTKTRPVIVTFDDQIEVVGDPPSVPFSQGGDSGSFIIDRDTMQAYALLYGGGPDDQGIDRTVAHFMPSVLSKLKVRLVQ